VGGPPIRVRLDDDLRRSRLTVFFRLLLAIPHLVWLVLWTAAAVVAVVLGWVIALATGRLPRPLHRFLAAYVRYGAHVSAYVLVVANPFPGFTGAPGYPFDVEIPAPERQRRWTVALRPLLAVPALLVGAAVGASGGRGGLAVTCGLLGWFAALATGRMPRGLRDLAAFGLGYTAQASAYALLLSPRYPSADPDAAGPRWDRPPHPVSASISDDGRRSRVTTLFRLLLAIPHLLWVSLWSVLALLAAIANGVVVLARGRSADALHRFLAAYVRYYAHVLAFITLVANPFPGFVGAPGYPVDVEIGRPERQSRPVTLFRIVLGLPALLVAAGYAAVLLVLGVLGWFAALATGRMPSGLRDLGAVAIRYTSETNAYWLVLTDRYPHASPALRPPPVDPAPIEAAA
jgi:hypothetical protein